MTTALPRARPPAAALAAAVALILLGCSVDNDGGRATELTPPERAVGEDLMVALSQARNYHNMADIFESENKPELAESALRQILDVPFPEGSPEAEDVELDARGRLGKLLLARGETESALAIVREGIDAAQRESFFLANLYTVKGEIHEARGEGLASGEGDPEAAARARERALEAYAESIAINERLQQDLMEEAAP